MRPLLEAGLGLAAHQAAGEEGKGGGVKAGNQVRECRAELNARQRNDHQAAKTITWQLCGQESWESGPGRYPALGHNSEREV